MTFERRCTGNGGEGHEAIWGQSTLGSGKRWCKGPEAGSCLKHLKKSKEARVL